ncbi:MAG TPA: hypothetical protein VFM55_13480 [Micromonosporaceae bacterium]|nr:hypothetical protein [Micromonosporaceae bacterium]
MPEIDIGASFGLFARWLHPIPGQSGRNLFDPAARTELATDAFVSFNGGRLAELRRAGIVADDVDGVTLAPLRGLLVLPRRAPDDGTPMVLIMHGMAPTFVPSTPSAANEVHSYRGYRYLQRHLAEAGIGSLSISANVVNRINGDDDYQRRCQLFVLHLALLSALAAGAAPTGTPLRCRLPRGMASLRTALEQPATQPTSASAPDVLLRDLSRQVREAELDLTRLAVMGHSRGATAVAELAEIVRGASAPSSASAVETEQRTRVAALVSSLRLPQPTHLKALLPLEPDFAGPYPMSLPDTFLLAVAGSHDEDVSSSAANIYEGARCPKAMLVMHGATHGRFNTVWRTLDYVKRVINESIRCQTSLGQPIRIMSNASHEEVLKSFAGALFRGRLRGQPDELLIFTGERRGPQGVDVTRAWRFPRGTISLDGGVASPTAATLANVYINNHNPYAQRDTPVFRIARPARQSATLSVPIGDGQLTGVTHLSCRMAKEHDVNSARARAAEPLRNFSLGLFTDTGLQIGRTIAGRAVPSIIHPVYPTRKFTVQDGEVCYDDTNIFLQTIEVPLTQFIARTRFTASDLARVRELHFGMLPATKAGQDIFCLVDFVLSTR